MENSMEARVSAQITTLKHVLFEFHIKESILIKVDSTTAACYRSLSHELTENNCAVAGFFSFIEFVPGH